MHQTTEQENDEHRAARDPVTQCDLPGVPRIMFTRPWAMRTVLYRRMKEAAQTLDYECLEFEEPFLAWDAVPSPELPSPPGR